MSVDADNDFVVRGPCACGRSSCSFDDGDRVMNQSMVIDGRRYRTICGIGVLYERAEALKFYADENNWQRVESDHRTTAASQIEQDGGQRARKALRFRT